MLNPLQTNPAQPNYEESAAQYAAQDVAGALPGESSGFSLVRVGSGSTCGSEATPLSAYTSEGLEVDLLFGGTFSSANPCGAPLTTPVAYGVAGMLNVLDGQPADTTWDTGNTGYWKSGAQIWAEDALSVYNQQCPNDAVSACPEIEVLDEPAACKFWWNNCDSPSTTSDTATQADAYAELLYETSKVFSKSLANPPLILASYDGGMRQSNPNTEWGRWLWRNSRRISLSDYVGGITLHPYGTNCAYANVYTTTGPRCARSASTTKVYDDAVRITHLPIYITEIGWSTISAQDYPEECSGNPYSSSVGCTPSSGPDSGITYDQQWNESDQGINYCTFMNWAEATEDIVQVIAYSYADDGGTGETDGNNEGSYFGLNEVDYSSATKALVTFTHKVAWSDLTAAADGNSCQGRQSR